jgi:heptosyltransferase-1
MRRILLVKTSSLGDVVHNLPVASDLRNYQPDIEIDWAVEESFSAIPALHPAVVQVIPVALRRWRRALLGTDTRREVGRLYARLQARAYDVVIDTQGLLKSALIARMAPGRRFGLDWVSAREPLWPFFHRTFRVSWKLHAIERNRQLAAKALGYIPASACTYGIAAPPEPLADWAARLQRDRYAVLLHATSADRKLWPEHQWIKLGDHLHHLGLQPVLPWGSETERVRSERIAKLLKYAIVPPQLSLREVAALLGRAEVVFGVDTGLTHLAVALGVPTVGIYCATDPAATGLYGSTRAVNVGGKRQVPPVATVLTGWRQVQT